MIDREQSRCTVPGSNHRAHRLIADADTPFPRRLVYEELAQIFTSFRELLTESERKDLYARFMELNELARQGNLTEGNPDDSSADLKPVSRDPLMWELRWNVPSFSPLRQYHMEPKDDLELLVIVKAHLKDLRSGSTATINDHQTAEINEGIARYYRERHTRWGLNIQQSQHQLPHQTPVDTRQPRK